MVCARGAAPLAAFTAILAGGALEAQTAPAVASSAFEFSIANIMRGPELYGREPATVRWTPDGRWIYFRWLPPGSAFQETLKPYRVLAQGGAAPERVSDVQQDSAGPLLAEGEMSRDRLRKVVEYRGDLFLVELRTQQVRRLTATIAAEQEPQFSSDGAQVLYIRDGNGYALDLAAGTLKQLTNIHAPEAAAPAAGAGAAAASPQRSALEADQRLLFESVRDQLRADSLRKADSTRREAQQPRAVVLRPGERVVSLSLSPAGTAVLFTTSSAAADARSGIVPNYVTASGYTEDILNRTKVGDVTPTVRIGFQPLPRGEVRWLQPIERDSTAPGNVGLLGWNAAGTRALLSAQARNFKTRQLSTVDAVTGTLSAIDVVRDSAWVGGPCGFGCAGFYDDDRRIYFVDESSGWAQLYSSAADGSDRRALTTGSWEVYDVALSAGSARTSSPTAEWLSFPWRKPEIVMVPASDGVAVPARIYRPADLGAAPNGAAVIFVHGAGYLHNVHHYWSSYPREYMFNHFLASKGYVVLDMDYRASAGYGRDWRTAIYRWMGGRDLQDQVDGSRYLTRTFGIDPERIGMYGGSYGGFMTLMALFTAPKFFGAGAALRSVTDWAHYNTGYTGAILNFPQNDSLAYHRSSPIYFAEGLEDPLLMAHGMVDTNVNFQDIVRLTERLIELHKTNWDLAVYPVEDHGFSRPASWADEYRRIYELFEAHLPATAASRAGGERP